MKAASHNFTSLDRLSAADLHEIIPTAEPNRMYSVLKSPGTKPALIEIPNVRRRLEALPTYGKHQPAIEAFFRAVENRKIPSPDLLTNWKG
jgi:hypothetical protein